MHFTLLKRMKDGEASVALLAGAMSGVSQDSCSHKDKYVRTSQGWALRPCQGGRSVLCTGVLFLQTGTRLTKRLKTGKTRLVVDDGSGLAALWAGDAVFGRSRIFERRCRQENIREPQLRTRVTETVEEWFPSARALCCKLFHVPSWPSGCRCRTFRIGKRRLFRSVSVPTSRLPRWVCS